MLLFVADDETMCTAAAYSSSPAGGQVEPCKLLVYAHSTVCCDDICCGTWVTIVTRRQCGCRSASGGLAWTMLLCMPASMVAVLVVMGKCSKPHRHAFGTCLLVQCYHVDCICMQR